MRFARLQLENFKAITSADLEFGPGLNVLHGPNDLGKSTLGVALRAALLLPSTSRDADAYVPWHEEVTPVVTLTFLDDALKYWKVRKRFTVNDATLSFSKDGKEFTVDAHERAVDERLRRILSWGLATPGGRAAPRGMPESFLANALLAAQTDVDAILSSSLESDLEQSGKVTLTRALSALAQDPLVRHVLDAAQKEHELYFTATGRKKSGQNAPLSLASEAVKKLTDELMIQQQALAESTAIEQETKRLHHAWLEAQQQAEAAEQSLRRAQAGLQRAGEKRAALERLAAEREALARVDGLAARVTTLDGELKGLSRQVAEQEAALLAAQQVVKAAALAVREAEEAHRKASSADGEAERAVARAGLKEALAAHSVERAQLNARLEKAKADRLAGAELERLTTLLAQLTSQLEPARAKLTEAEGEAALTGALMNYGAWRVAGEASRVAEQGRAQAQKVRAEALEKTAAALGVQQGAKALEDEVAMRRQALPEDQQRALFQKLRRALELAEASLGGGVTVVVRPRTPLLLRSSADESASDEQRVSREFAIEADRRVQLAIGDLVDIEVIAGAAEKRKDAEHLRKKWKTEALPALEKAGLRTLGELDEAFAQLDERLGRAKAQRQDALQLEREAQSLRERAAMLEEKGAGAPTAAQLEEKRLGVGGYSFEALQPLFEGMGESWESQARPLHEKKTQALAQARATVSQLEGELKLTQHRLADAKARQRGPGDDVVAVEQSLRAVEAQLAQGGELLRLLEQERSGAVEDAATKREQAQRQLVLVEAAAATATQALTELRGTASARKGERDATAAQWTAANQAAVAARVEAAELHLASFADVELLTPDELAARERAVDQARAAAELAGREHATAEGALSKVGGPQAREQVRQLEEALTAAKAREHFIEVDASAWRLLVEAVREAEEEDSSSLGSALAGPVTTRFAELTKGRYPAVRFDPSLKTTGLDVAGTQSSPEGIVAALSVGTRDHLATLVRLAIAVQLKSAIVLDDHLVHTDLGRLAWFREALRQAATQTQVVVLTCRPLDYLSTEPLAADTTRAIDLAKVIKRR